MKERIYVGTGVAPRIAQEVGCCRMTVTHALMGRRKRSKQAYRIRQIALRRYGGMYRDALARTADEIRVPYGSVVGLAMRHRVTTKTVSNALQGVTRTPLARRIRETALDSYGGVRLVDGKMPVDITRYEGDLMIQEYGNGVRLEASRSTGEVWLYHDHELVEHGFDLTIEQLMALQSRAVSYSEQMDRRKNHK